jgi:hypothetical protein
MQSRRAVWSKLALLLSLALISAGPVFGQDDTTAHRGRKYKAPPATSHIEITVLKKANGKPIMNAAVVFNSTLNGQDEGSMEVKTDPDGKAVLDVIPTGSTVTVQVIATGYATYAKDYLVVEPNREISISMIRPQAQVSAYQDNSGKASTMKPGVQEPIRPKAPAPTPAPSSTTPQDSTTPAPAPKQ